MGLTGNIGVGYGGGVGKHSYLIAIGSNRRGRGRSPRTIVADAPIEGLRALSRVHTTPAMGPGTRSYANAVAIVKTDRRPRALLKHLKSIERAHGRRPGRRWGDRVLDLDIIGWSGGIWVSPGLAIPHPAFRERGFVLAPLTEVAPDWRDPVTHLTARQLRARLDRKRPRA